MLFDEFVNYAQGKGKSSKPPYRDCDSIIVELNPESQGNYCFRVNAIYCATTNILRMRIRETNEILEKYPRFLIKHAIKLGNYYFTLLQDYWIEYDVGKLSYSGQATFFKDCLVHIYRSSWQLMNDIEEIYPQYAKDPNKWVETNIPSKINSLSACLHLPKDNSLILIDSNEYITRFNEEPPGNFVPFRLGIVRMDSHTNKVIITLLEERNEKEETYSENLGLRSNWFDIDRSEDFTGILKRAVDKLFFEGNRRVEANSGSLGQGKASDQLTNSNLGICICTDIRDTLINSELSRSHLQLREELSEVSHQSKGYSIAKEENKGPAATDEAHKSQVHDQGSIRMNLKHDISRKCIPNIIPVETINEEISHVHFEDKSNFTSYSIEGAFEEAKFEPI